MSHVSVSVVVCTYTAARWDALRAGVDAALAQLEDGDEVLVVVDHAPDVLDLAGSTWAGERRCRVLPNAHTQGLSGARNTGVEAATCEAVAFLDDDALPGPSWLDGLRRRLEEPAVAGVGGAVDPAWEGGRAPRWFPPEFLWVVGCDYVGLPGDGQRLRNPIGASMALRRAAVLSAGGFSELVGRVGTLPAGCEETELGIRLASADPSTRIVRDTRSTVAHLVPASRQTLRYFRSRCWHEGRSKAVLSRLVGQQDALASERDYVRRVLPRGVVKHLAATVRGDLAGPARAAVILLGLLTTAAGYLSARRALPPAS